MRNLMIRPSQSPLARDVDNMFEDFLGWSFPSWLRSRTSEEYSPRVDIRETEDKYFLTFEVPGMKKDDINISMRENMLTVSGQRKEEKEEKNEGFIRREIASGSFSRSFTIPETVNTDSISAEYRDGLLEISMDKLEKVKPKEVKIKVK